VLPLSIPCSGDLKIALIRGSNHIVPSLPKHRGVYLAGAVRVSR